MDVPYTDPITGRTFVIHVADNGCVTGVTTDAYIGDPITPFGVTYDDCKTVEFIMGVIHMLALLGKL